MSKMVRRKKMFLVLAILWYLVILTLSAQTASISSNISGGITERLIITLEKLNVVPINSHQDIYFVDTFHTYIRKFAHMFEYFILATIVTNYFYNDSKINKKYIFLALLITIIAASFDELFQTTIDGRSGQVTDVLIDGVGSSIGVLLTKIYKVYRNN